MPTIARLIGGAGTGKTTELLRIMQQTIDTGEVGPETIGFVSFTRAARAEAASRAAEKFGCQEKELQHRGWFRTLHSVCYRCLEAKEVLTEDASGKKWLKESLGMEVDHESTDEEDGMGIVIGGPKTDASIALAIWQAARNRLIPLDKAWREYDAQNPSTPTLENCRVIIERYELHKRIDHKRDFVDLLGDFAGWKFSLDGAEKADPQGWVPELPVWFFDEQQDTSKLLDSVCHRLISTPGCRWVYVVGDPFQSIYGFAGSDSRCFREWPAAKERTMPKSYRCPPHIHSLGESILAECSDYFDRGIAPADHTGEVDKARSLHDVIGDIDPRDSWLLIARTNFQARRIQNLLNRGGVPWLPTKGHGGWNAPKRKEALLALYSLQTGYPIGWKEWRTALDVIPSKSGDAVFLERGAKSKWSSDGFKPEADLAKTGDLTDWGATETLKKEIASGGWQSFVEHGERYSSAIRSWGIESVENPQIKVGTIHSVKGAQADNVAVLTTTSEPVSRSMENQEGFNEERRVAYVAVTRAKRRLVIVEEPRERNRMEIDL